MGLGSWGHISCTHRPVWRQGESIHFLSNPDRRIKISIVIIIDILICYYHCNHGGGQLHSGDLFLFELRLRRSLSKADAGYRSPRGQGWGHSKSSCWTFIMLILLIILSSGLSCSSHLLIVLIMLSSYWPIDLINCSGDAPEAWIPDGRRRELREGAREISPLCVNHLNY